MDNLVAPEQESSQAEVAQLDLENWCLLASAPKSQTMRSQQDRLWSPMPWLAKPGSMTTREERSLSWRGKCKTNGTPKNPSVVSTTRSYARPHEKCWKHCCTRTGNMIGSL